MMLVRLNHYRRRHALAVFISIATLDALLLAGFIWKRGYSQFELAFAMIAIIAGITYASVRDAAGQYAYAVEALKFFRDEDDFAFLQRYTSGWRKQMSYLLNPCLAAMVMSAVFLLLSLWPGMMPAHRVPRLLITAGLVVVLFPLLLSRLLYVLSPLLVWWRELQTLGKTPSPASPSPSLSRFIRTRATQDLLVTLIITVALVLPVRHQPDFHPEQGYATVAFFVAALILVWIVLHLSLLSAWRTRRSVCAGELYRFDLTPPVDAIRIRSRWARWRCHVLLMTIYTGVACCALEAIPASFSPELILLLLLWPVAAIFWHERHITLTSNFHDALRLVTEFPPRMLVHSELAKAA